MIPAIGVEEYDPSDVAKSQTWKSVTMAGQSIRYFQESPSSGTDAAYYSTVGFSHPSATGKTGYYRVVATGIYNATEIEKLMKSVSF